MESLQIYLLESHLGRLRRGEEPDCAGEVEPGVPHQVRGVQQLAGVAGPEHGGRELRSRYQYIAWMLRVDIVDSGDVTCRY